MKTKFNVYQINSLPRALAYSLGVHGLALALVVMVSANGVRPRQTLETFPFIHASLIYAMNGQSDHVTPAQRTPKVKLNVDHRPMETPPAVRKINDKNPHETMAPQSAAANRSEDVGVGKDAPVLLHLPSLGSDGIGQITSRGEMHGNDPQAGRLIPPRYLEAARPSYPLMARMRGYEGMVLLAVEVLKDGRAGEVRIKQSSGYAMLDESALKAVSAWRFEPARKTDVPLAMTVDIPIRFSLKEAE